MVITVKLSRDENIQKYGSNIVTLDMEEYLKGVVPAEIGNSALEACKAQAVAARTFALSKYNKNGQITDSSSSDQAFRSSRISSSYPNALLAVEQTAGEVLYYNNKLIDTCVFSASNGGHIKSSQQRWGGYRAYLIAKDDPYDTGSGNGHGVGMSQVGAKNMASQGFTYKDILAFYYPNTEIRSNYGKENTVPMSDSFLWEEIGAEENQQLLSKAAQLVAWAKSKLGCGYIWGTYGQICNQSLIKAKHNQYPDHVDPQIVKKWIGKQVFDCAGFLRAGLTDLGIEWVSGAGSQWRTMKWAVKGTIDKLPYDKVCCLYRQDSNDKNKMAHAGLYIGNGDFIHAAGQNTGVVQSTIAQYGKWTHWGIPEGLYDENELIDLLPKVEVLEMSYKAMVTPKTGSTVKMRAEPNKQAAVLLAIPGSKIVEVVEHIGTDWSKIIFNGQTGYMMSEFLVAQQPVVTSTPAPTTSGSKWYVRIECASETEAKAVAKILGRATATT